MMLLRERIGELRSLPGQARSSPNNWVLYYLSKHGHLPPGWELVFGVPYFTGEKRSKRKLARTHVLLPSLKTEGATISANVNPDVRDVNPIPVPKTGGTSAKTFHRAFRANLTSGDRTKTHHETMKPHQACGEVYSPQCRDKEWQLPIWIGGTDWVTRPLYRHEPPDVRQTFAQDPSGRIPEDVPLAHGPPGFIPPNIAILDPPREVADVDLAATAFSDIVDEAIGYKLDDPIGLVSKISAAAKSTATSLRNAWATLAKSGPSGLDVPLPPRKRRRVDPDDKPPVFAPVPRPKTGTSKHDAVLYRQAIELRRMLGKTMYIVDYNGRRYTTSHPQKHGRVIHVVEATTSASFPTQTASGTTFYGRRGLATVEKERRARMGRQSASKCGSYDPKCRDKEWEVPAQTGGVALPLLKRSSVIS